MLKTTKVNYSLNDGDKLVFTFENGKISMLINNEIKVIPQSIDIRSSFATESFNRDKGVFEKHIQMLNIECEV